MSHKPIVHSLDSLHEGLVERFVFKPTNEMMRLFVEISGDVSPVHTDSNYATSRGFDGVVVYGGILVAQISRMVGMHLPGRDALSRNLNIHYVTLCWSDSRLNWRRKLHIFQKQHPLLNWNSRSHLKGKHWQKEVQGFKS